MKRFLIGVVVVIVFWTWWCSVREYHLRIAENKRYELVLDHFLNKR